MQSQLQDAHTEALQDLRATLFQDLRLNSTPQGDQSPRRLSDADGFAEPPDNALLEPPDIAQRSSMAEILGDALMGNSQTINSRSESVMQAKPTHDSSLSFAVHDSFAVQDSQDSLIEEGRFATAMRRKHPSIKAIPGSLKPLSREVRDPAKRVASRVHLDEAVDRILSHSSSDTSAFSARPARTMGSTPTTIDRSVSRHLDISGKHHQVSFFNVHRRLSTLQNTLQ
jgi:hypothetical protein